MSDVAPPEVEDQGQELAFELDFSGPWTLNELVEIEEIAGEPLGDISGRLMLAAAWVMAKRLNPQVSIQSVGDEIKVQI